MTGLDQGPGYLFRGIVDGVPNAHERVTEMQKRGRLGLVDHYAMGDIEVHLHFSPLEGVGNKQSGHYCAVLHRAVLHGFVPNTRVSAVDTDYGCQGDLKNCMDFAVLIDVVQLSQRPEWLRSGVLPSVVRLQGLNDCLYFRGDRVEPFGLVGNGIVPNGEADSLWSGRRVSFIEDRGEPNGVVESPSKILKTVTEKIGDVRQWWTADSGDIPFTVDEPRPVRVWFRDGFVGCYFGPSLDDFLYRFEMYTCPLEFSNSGRIVGHAE